MKIKNWLTKERWIQNERFLFRFYYGSIPWSYYQNPYVEKACLLGTIHLCYRGKELVEIVKLVKEKIKIPIDHWNDDPNRTYEEVHSLVKELDI